MLLSFSRQRTPLLLATFVGGSALFIGLKWRAVLARSEAAKDTAKGINYSVAPGRSGRRISFLDWLFTSFWKK